MIKLSSVAVAVDRPECPGPQFVLRNLNLELTEKRIAIIGANGSGKSTLLRLINGLTLPTAGEVETLGKDTADRGKEIRRQVGFIFTDPLSQLVMATPVEDVALSLRSAGVPRAQRRARALEILAAQGLSRVANQSIYSLSGGERQLVALAAVLAVEPRVILADEPTTLLDLVNRAQLLEALAQLDQQIIFATHDLELAATTERVIVLTGGEVTFDGKPAAGIEHYREAMAAVLRGAGQAGGLGAKNESPAGQTSHD